MHHSVLSDNTDVLKVENVLNVFRIVQVVTDKIYIRE